MKITTSFSEEKRQYLIKRHGNVPGLYLSSNGDHVWVVDANGSVAGFFGTATQVFHSVYWDNNAFKDNEHVIRCKIYPAPAGFELKVSQ